MRQTPVLSALLGALGVLAVFHHLDLELSHEGPVSADNTNQLISYNS